MDNLRGLDPLNSEISSEDLGYIAYADSPEDPSEVTSDLPPVIGNDERRMQVRAYNFWTAQLHNKNYPSIEELDPESVDDFREYSVLLDFTSGIENPSIQYLGEKLRIECGLSEEIGYLDEVPSRSLLSRITDHYMQIIANRAPIGFEAEFVNDRGLTIMYRGILLPYSSDDDTIDFIYGVINWKEVASDHITQELHNEVTAALRDIQPRHEHVPVWADSPTNDALDNAIHSDELMLDGYAEAPMQVDENSSLSDWLEAAQHFAHNARDADSRGRDALYQAIGRAYDFSVYAQKQPSDYAALLQSAGLKAQDRAPMTPIVKLVFGADYDKTRLTEFAAALNFAHRNVAAIGSVSSMIAGYDGGLKGIVKAERQARKVASGKKIVAPKNDPRMRLRTARARDLLEYAGGEEEFIVLVARREANGSVAIIGSVEGDASLTEKALRQAI